MFETSSTTAALDKALVAVQAKLRPAAKSSYNPFFKSNYADLGSVWDACRELLTANGVSVTQWPVHHDDGKLHIITRLACAGEWMRCEFSIPVTKQDPQSFGAAATYARRFALAAAVGIVADEDDDGERQRDDAPSGDRRNDLFVENVRGWSCAIEDAADLDALRKIGERLGKEPDAVKVAVRGEYAARSKKLEAAAKKKAPPKEMKPTEPNEREPGAEG